MVEQNRSVAETIRRLALSNDETLVDDLETSLLGDAVILPRDRAELLLHYARLGIEVAHHNMDMESLLEVGHRIDELEELVDDILLEDEKGVVLVDKITELIKSGQRSTEILDGLRTKIAQGGVGSVSMSDLLALDPSPSITDDQPF